VSGEKSTLTHQRTEESLVKKLFVEVQQKNSTKEECQLEDIMLSEVSQAQKDKTHVFSFIRGIYRSNTNTAIL
jgi:hypothetical protein